MLSCEIISDVLVLQADWSKKLKISNHNLWSRPVKFIQESRWKREINKKDFACI